MTPYLPYALDEDDEFLHPSLGWLLLARAIAYDSWISWRQALPIDRHSRNSLPETTSRVITALAEEVDAVHQRMPGYSDLYESPIVFPRWWDPYSGDEWATGSCCLFRITGFASRDIMGHWHASSSRAVFKAVSGLHVEARLTTNPEELQPDRLGPSAPRSRTRGKGRKNQSQPS